MIPRGARKRRPKGLGESCMRAYRGANSDRRAKAVRALGLLAGSAETETAAVQGLRDEKPSMRSAAATALGSMHAEHGGISQRRWGQRTERCAGRDEFAAAASRRCGPRHVLRSAHRRETREAGADQRAIPHAERQKKRWRKWDSKRELVLFRLPESATRFSKRRRKTIPRRCAPPCSKPLPCAVPRSSFPKSARPSTMRRMWCALRRRPAWRA